MEPSTQPLIDRTFVVCIGVDDVPDLQLDPLHYATKDAADVAAEFGHESRGVADPVAGNIVCLSTPAQTTRSAVMSALTEASEKCLADDLLVVYFAGHGVPDARSSAMYLATSDMRRMASGRYDSATTIGLSNLITEVFQPCRGYSLFLLDSCFSGSYADEEARLRRIGLEAEAGMVAELETLKRRHYAMLSCRSTALSREDASLRQGLFTHYLLRGLRGDDHSVINKYGQVTAGRLFQFIDEECESQPPIDITCPERQRMVLSRPGRHAGNVAERAQHFHAAPAETTWVIEPLRNPLNRAPELVEALVRSLSGAPDIAASRPNATATAVHLVRELTGADHARLVHHTVKPGLDEVLGTSSDGRPSAFPHPAFMPLLASRITTDKLRTADGFSVRAGDGLRSDGSTGVIAIPTTLRSSNDFDVLLLEGLPSDSPWRGDLGAALIRGALKFIQTPAAIRRPEALEAALLDCLRTIFGRVPAEMYERRFALFCQELIRQEFVFEPIVRIADKATNVHIDSWEALARDPDRPKTVPQHLFDAAELWGRRFIIELDSVFLRRAVAAYIEAHERTTDLGHHAGPMQKVSVNVYPESIVSDVYRQAVVDTLRDNNLTPSYLVLELSEKRPLARADELEREGRAVDVFNRRLDQLVSEASGISFAIDDFGVGHASLDRLAKLKLAHVKIDREVLFHEAAIDELSLVNEITRRIGRTSNKVVVEGFDGHAPVELGEIFAIAKIEYVQGWLFPFASPVLSQLPEELREEVASEVRRWTTR